MDPYALTQVFSGQADKYTVGNETSPEESQMPEAHEIIRSVAAEILRNNPELSAIAALNLARIQFELPVIVVGGAK